MYRVTVRAMYRYCPQAVNLPAISERSNSTVCGSSNPPLCRAASPYGLIPIQTRVSVHLIYMILRLHLLHLRIHLVLLHLHLVHLVHLILVLIHRKLLRIQCTSVLSQLPIIVQTLNQIFIDNFISTARWVSPPKVSAIYVVQACRCCAAKQ